MRRPDLIAEVHMRAGCISKKEAAECVSVVAKAIEQALTEGRFIRIDDFGHYYNRGFVPDGKLREGMAARGVKVRKLRKPTLRAKTMAR